MISKSKQLAALYGGVWEYDRVASWHCDDGVRKVIRVHTGGYDLNGEPMPGCGYFLYGDGTPKRVIFPVVKTPVGVFS